MILIADSGSSKTDWAVVTSKSSLQLIESVGLNPDFHSESSIGKEIQKIADQLESSPEVIQFYGSGASSKARQAPLLGAFKKSFPKAEVYVSHDLLGAARACLGDLPGLVGILGTGSNCCTYDGNEISREFRSGGFILSDEGGGVYMGKMLLKAYIEGELEADLRQSFDHEFNLNIDMILHKIYKEKMPNRFIASFSEFIGNHQTHPQIRDIIYENFNAFFKQKVCRFEDYHNQPLGIVGSIADHFESQLRDVAQTFQCNISRIEAKPIGALIKYHQAKLG